MTQHFTIKFVPVVNGKFLEEMLTGTPASDIKLILNSITSKLQNKLKDQYNTLRVEIMNVVAKPVSETEYKKLEDSFFKFE